jgi:hypothetical protein
MHLRAVVLVENSQFPGFDPPWAMKLYAIVHADASAMRAGLEWANAIVRAGDISTGLKIFEEQLVPLVERERFMGWIVPVYVDYARALARGGRFNTTASSFTPEIRIPFNRLWNSSDRLSRCGGGRDQTDP